MDRLGERNEMHVLVKNLVTGRIRRIVASDLFQLHVDSHEYSPFSPTSSEDFEKKKYYGEIIGDQMVLNYILAMSESEEQIKEMFQDPRKFHIPNPKRLSTSPASEPLRMYTLVKEKNDTLVSKNSKKQSKALSKQGLDKKIIEKYHNKSGKELKDKESKSHSEATIKHDFQDDQQSTDHPLSKRSSASAVLGDGDRAIKKKKTESEICSLCPSLQLKVNALEEVKSALEFKVKALEDVNAKLNANLTKAESIAADLDLKWRDLDRVNTALQEKVNIFESKEDGMKQLKATLTETMEAISNKGCGLSNLSTARTKSAEGQNEYVDCGGGITVMKSDIAEKELKSEKLSSRLRGLCDLFWGEKLHEMHLTYEPNMKGSVIEEIHITSLATLLNTMEWDTEELLDVYRKTFPKKKEPFKIPTTNPITSHIVRCALRQTTYNARVKHEKTLLTTEERLAEKAQKKTLKKKVSKVKKQKKQMANKGTDDEKEEEQAVEKDDGEDIARIEQKSSDESEVIGDETKRKVVEGSVENAEQEEKEEKSDVKEFLFVKLATDDDNYSESDTSLLQESPHK